MRLGMMMLITGIILLFSSMIFFVYNENTHLTKEKSVPCYDAYYNPMEGQWCTEEYKDYDVNIGVGMAVIGAILLIFSPLISFMEALS